MSWHLMRARPIMKCHDALSQALLLMELVAQRRGQTPRELATVTVNHRPGELATVTVNHRAGTTELESQAVTRRSE